MGTEASATHCKNVNNDIYFQENRMRLNIGIGGWELSGERLQKFAYIMSSSGDV